MRYAWDRTKCADHSKKKTRRWTSIGFSHMMLMTCVCVELDWNMCDDVVILHDT